MISKLIVSFVLIILIIASLVTGIKCFDNQDLEIDQLLKKLNKPALKSIQSPDGEIIDCVHIKNHPIYDHPLFKNHTIQRIPSPHPEGWKNEPSDEERKSLVTQLWTINGKCPKNSIPIKRTKREDILRTKSIERYRKKDPKNIRQLNLANSNNSDTYEYAELRLQGMFHGAQGIINVWKPYIEILTEFSGAQVWIYAGPRDQMNAIEFGWQVNPLRNLDFEPRFFIYWTADGYHRTGCYNFDCPGFVLLSQDFALDIAIHQVSVLNGTQYDIPATIWKDSRTGNWWLKINYHIIVGYWPSSLFNHLGNGATNINFGGTILNHNHNGQHTATKMGSGNFAKERYRKASYFKNLQIFNQNGSWEAIQGFTTFRTKSTCYSIQSGKNGIWGNYFYYGGPGRNPNCL